MPRVVQQCSAYFRCKHIGNGVLLVAKATVALWQPIIACPLQGETALHVAAKAGHVDVVETLLLNHADPEARDTMFVSCTNCISIFSIDTTYLVKS